MIKQLNISDLNERAKVSFNLNHDEETAWVELKTFYLEKYNTTIPVWYKASVYKHS